MNMEVFLILKPEIRSLLIKNKSNKAAGLDGIVTEMLTTLDNLGIDCQN